MHIRPSIRLILLIIFLTCASLFYFGGIAAVPFHPDESTQIFMSSDLEQFFHQPASLFWRPEKESDLRQHYREMDAPLTRILIGTGRALAGIPQLRSDWNWSLSWQANQAAGALPDARLLLISRLAVVWFYPFTLLTIFLTGRQIGGETTAWIAMLITASSALILLHTRRAMAESGLVFFTALSLWALVKGGRQRWLTAIPIALAINAKQIGVPLILVGLAAILWCPAGKPETIRQRLIHCGLYLGLIAAITAVLNPFLWSAPIEAARAALNARQQFSTAQALSFETGGAGMVAASLPERTAGMIYQLFLAAPAAADVGNYQVEMQSAIQAYLAFPLHTLLRGAAGGGILLAGSLTGLFIALRTIFTRAAHRRVLMLLTGFTLVQTATMIGLISVMFQRYYLIMIPLIALWCGVAAQSLVQNIHKRGSQKQASSSAGQTLQSS